MRDARFPKFLVFINSLVPLSLLLWDAYWNHLGPNPVLFAIHTTGMLALIFLLLSLSVTPLRRITGQNFFSHFRRMLGLFAFFYGCVHLSLYFVFDRSLSISSTIHDVIKRPFILFGMAALLAMVPLAITSTNKMIKRLGAVRWKRLHRLVYFAAVAAVVHYYLLVKADTRIPVAFAATLALLFGIRLIYSASRSIRSRQPAGAGR
ncbi:MAG TPA: protein-methionine-sulfoxide reductase heme-binding subunit MsrQ [Tepidisphaeraceae bacterium]|nr:protein-methionine-sulfoxide reductase heme-binding subunit MsrQ [Tepidisphaeraceae bacterium]